MSGEYTLPYEHGGRKRPRGAPPGNQNARKHGYYSRVLARPSRHSLGDAALVSGIDEEIALLRFHIRDILEKEPDNVRLQLEAAKVLCRLLKTRCQLGGERRTALKDAIHKVLAELAVPLGASFPPLPEASGP